MARYVVIGTSGAGKTTLARQIAQRMDIPHIEVDALHWEPGWVAAPPETMRQRVEKAVTAPDWALDGNYSATREIVWSRATHLIWLDYSFPVIWWRICSRTLYRAITQEELWNGNRESLRTLFSRDSLLLWVLKTYGRRRRQYPELLTRPEYGHLAIFRLRTPTEAERWLSTLQKQES